MTFGINTWYDDNKRKCSLLLSSWTTLFSLIFFVSTSKVKVTKISYAIDPVKYIKLLGYYTFMLFIYQNLSFNNSSNNETNDTL